MNTNVGFWNWKRENLKNLLNFYQNTLSDKIFVTL